MTVETKFTPPAHPTDEIKERYLDAIDALHKFALAVGAVAGDDVIAVFSNYQKQLFDHPPTFNGVTLVDTSQ